jgi:hypothetical protein
MERPRVSVSAQTYGQATTNTRRNHGNTGGQLIRGAAHRRRGRRDTPRRSRDGRYLEGRLKAQSKTASIGSYTHLVTNEPQEKSGKNGRHVTRQPTHHGKYAKLFDWLRRQPGPSVTVSFTKVEEILGFALPPSSRRHMAHWYGYKGSAVARAIADAGWKASEVNLTAERVTFIRR